MQGQMAKLTERLTDLAVKNAKPGIRPDGTMKTTLLPDGDGLYLQVGRLPAIILTPPSESLSAEVLRPNRRVQGQAW